MIPDRRVPRLFPALLAASLTCWPVSPRAMADGPPRPIDILEKSWPDHPEWAAMLVDILGGSQLGPSDGWFRKATAKTRFTWDATRAALDKDGDGTINRAEFAGRPADFARLDRDRDGALTPPDFDFSPHALMPSPGAMLYSMADRDGNGKVTREEFEGVFRALDDGGLGFLSQDDLRRALAPPPPRPPSPASARPSSGPSRWTLVKGLFRQEIGSLQAGPDLDAPAPDFTLKTANDLDEVTLSKLVGPKPVVLIFGNFTCGPFRSQAGNIEKLHARYKDRATFVMVYVREAHPTDGWSMDSNDRVGVALRQPRTFGERVEVARRCGKALKLGFPMLVDTIDDAVGARYSGMPGRFYLIDPKGKVASKSGRGPFGFKVAELEQSLILLLNQGDPQPTAPASKEAARPLSPKDFDRVVIDPDFPGGYQVEVADVNGDGKPDIVALGGGTCAWYENPGWTKRIVTTPAETPDIISSATADLDGDGKAEIAIAYDFAMDQPRRGKLLLATQSGDGRWTTRPIADVPSIHRLRWADFDADGRPELVVAPLFGATATPPKYDQGPARIVVYHTGADPKSGVWSFEFPGGDRVLHAIRVMDIDGDGRPEILTAGNLGVTRFDQGYPWTSRMLSAGARGEAPKRGSSEVQVGRLADGSRFLATVDPWHGSEVSVSMADGRGGFGPRLVIDDSLVDGHALWVADVDGDGDDEIFGGYRGGGTGVLLFDRVGGSWVKSVLDSGIAAQDLRGGDLDGDGTPDVVAIGGKSHNVVWYRPIRRK